MGQTYKPKHAAQPKHRATSPSGLALLGLAMKDRARLLIAGGATVAIAASGVVIVPVAFQSESVAQAADLTIDGKKVIESGVATAETETVNGVVSRYLGNNPQTRDANSQLPLAGVRVYAKWVEKDGSSSPIYTAVTDANGQYHIKMLPFKDPNGITRSFDADPNLPEGEKIRVWAENPDPAHLQAMYLYQNGQVGPQGIVADTTAGVSQLVGPNQYNDVPIQFVDIQDHQGMHRDAPKQVPGSPDPTPLDNGGQISGSVYWNHNVPAGNLIYGGIYEQNKGDVPVPNMQVRGSYLSDQAIKKIYAEAPAALGVKTIRGAGWNRQQELLLQDWIKQQIAKDGKDFWIAETVETTTDDKGNYTLYFNGTWGPWANYTGDQTFWSQDQKARLGTVAGSPKDGKWDRVAGAAGNTSKHINTEWSFVSITELPGTGLITPYVNNQYFSPVDGSAWPGLLDLGRSNLTDVKFALFPENIVFDVSPFDSYANFATAGQSVTTSASGLPYQQNGGTKYQVEWTDQDGNVVKSGADCTFAVNPDGSIPSCDFTTPKDLTKQTTYSARLYSLSPNGVRSDLPVAIDSFTVDPLPVTDKNDPSYTTAVTTPGTEVTIATPTFDNPQTKDVVETNQAPQGTTFAPGTPAEGQVVPPWIKMNPDGSITANPPADAQPGNYTIPVLVTYPDGTQDTVSALVTISPAPVKTADTLIPEYAPVAPMVPGTSASVLPPTFDGVVTPERETGAAPQGTTFAPKDQSVPWVTVDPNTGALTVSPDANVEPGDYSVTVVVTYPDKSTEEVVVPITVTAAPKPLLRDSNVPSYTPVATAPGKEVTTAAPTFDDPTTTTVQETNKAPEGTTYEPGIPLPGQVVPSWIQLNTDGTITAKPPADAAPGDYQVPVQIIYPDGSKDPATATVTVTKEPVATPVDQSVIDGKQLTPIKLENVPAGAKVEVTGLPAGVTFDPATNTISGTPDVTDWGATEEARAFAPVVTVTNGDQTTQIPVTITVQRDTDNDGIPDLTDTDDDGDGFTDAEEIIAKSDPKNKDSVPEKLLATPTNQTVVEGQPMKAVALAGIPAGATVTATGLPNGATLDTATNTISGTPDISDWSPTEESRDVVVTVKVDNGGQITEVPVTITVQRDTDNDGIPDITDTDDDNDGFTDEIEAAAKSDPKDPNSKPAAPVSLTVTPDTQTVIDGAKITPIVVTGVPADTKITDTGLPNGLTFDQATNTVTGSLDITDWEKTEETREVPVALEVTYPGQTTAVPLPVTITVQRDTDGNGIPDVTDTDDDGDGFTDEQEKAANTDPKDPNSKPALATDAGWADTAIAKPGEAVEIPLESGTLNGQPSLDVAGPGTATIGLDGTITVTPNAGAKPGDVITVAVKDKDGKVIDTITVTVAASVSPTQQTVVAGKDIVPVAVTGIPAGKDVTVTDLPEGLTFDKATNTISGIPTVANWGTDEEKTFTAIVAVPQADGSTENVPVEITVQRDTDGDGIPDVTDADDDNDGFTDEQEKAKNTDPKDPNSKPDAGVPLGVTPDKQVAVEGTPMKPVEVVGVPEGATVTATNLPAGVTFDEASKTIAGSPDVTDWKPEEEERVVTSTVTVSAGGDTKFELPVEITVQRDTDGDGTPDVTDADDDGDGFTDAEEAIAGTNPKDPASKPAQSSDAQWNDAVTKPGEPVTVPIASGALNGAPTLEITGPGIATIAPDGTITVTPNADAKPGDEITVTVKDKDGKVIDTVTVTVQQPGAGTTPDWGDVATAIIGGAVGLPIIAGALAGGETVTATGPGTAEIGPDGTITVTPNADAKPGDEITVTVKDKDGQTVDTIDVTVTDNGDGTTATIAPIGDVTVDEGEPITPITVTTGNPKAEIDVTGLPAGVNFDPVTGLITGTPLVPGSYPVTVTAKIDGKPVSTEKFTITVGDTSGTGQSNGSSNGAGLIGALLGGLGLGAILGAQGSSDGASNGSSAAVPGNGGSSNNQGSKPGQNVPGGAADGGSKPGTASPSAPGANQTPGTGQPSQAPGANQAPDNGAGNSVPGDGQGQSVTTPAPSSPKATGQQPGSKPGGALANTGVDDLMLIVGGSLLAMTVGGLLILAAKRRREAESKG
ncbi:Rib/alpha-like domain-containing protein [Corynebacterium tapiri]|uniref:Long Rib domain-containing protein n=1 Tax=Corynebacterium tapiri TaxID=1448266 RepID=A0A5C4U2X1_9CORY|nr:Rib/alpha-like domain-containing protein [Corynebacterium tapiri]TNL96884.1 hypothetical protein FHE74_07670 [Corynebacterium tapiri]